MLLFYIIELYYIVCFSMTNKSMRTFYVNKNSVCLSVIYIIDVETNEVSSAFQQRNISESGRSRAKGSEILALIVELPHYPSSIQNG